MKKFDWSKEKVQAFNNPAKYLNETIQEANKALLMDTNNISDGYHTFGELYEHRILLFIQLCNIAVQFMENMYGEDSEADIEEMKKNLCIKSKKNKDLNSWDGWFVMQLETPGGQISYHLPMKYWEMCSFATEVESNSKYDGHTSEDVIKRLSLI